MQAQALRLSGEFSIDALTFDTIDLPQPGPHDVVVAIRAVSLNYRDLMLVQGVYMPDVQKPRIPCSDGAGEVISVGDAVTRFQVGDRVMTSFYRDWINGRITFAKAGATLGGTVDGTLATHIVLPEHALAAVPEELTLEEAATLPCAAVTAWQAMVTLGNIGADDTVVLLGTGGVSIAGLQIAKLRGARTIITSSSDEKLERAKSLGADEIINYKTTPAWDKRVRELTGKAGATHVLETGGAGTLPLSIKAAGYDAQVSVIGVLSGVEQPIDIRPLLSRNIRVQGITVGSRTMLEEVAAAFATSGTHPVIDRTFRFDESKDAIRALQAAEHFGKIVIRVS